MRTETAQKRRLQDCKTHPILQSSFPGVTSRQLAGRVSFVVGLVAMVLVVRGCAVEDRRMGA